MTCKVIIQNFTTLVFLDTGTNTSSVLEKFFNSLPQKPKLCNTHTHKVTSASGANLGQIGQCDFTFREQVFHS